MAYTPKTWADGSAGGTLITAGELNRIEAGVNFANNGPDGFIPADAGFKAWTYDPTLAASSTVLVGGQLNVSRIPIRTTETISAVTVHCFTSGATLTNAGFALYSLAGALLASSVNENGSTVTAFQTTGMKTVTFAVPQVITGHFYVGFWFTGTTIPALARGSSSTVISNAGFTTPTLRHATANSNLTTAAPTTLAAQGNGTPYWTAVA